MMMLATRWPNPILPSDPFEMNVLSVVLGHQRCMCASTAALRAIESPQEIFILLELHRLNEFPRVL